MLKNALLSAVNAVATAAVTTAAVKSSSICDSPTAAIEGSWSLSDANTQLSLKINKSEGKTFRVQACANWTVLRLKKEILRCNNQPESGRLVLQYGEKMLSDDDALLNAYNILADSVIEATFSRHLSTRVMIMTNDIPNVDTANPSEYTNGALKLIGNCVALINGIEVVDGNAISKGSLIVAGLDFSNLTIGEIRLTCKINGFGNSIFVGVKFRKQLSLGSSVVEINHVDTMQGHCDNCKGRRSLFIPIIHIGKGKLFQVQ